MKSYIYLTVACVLVGATWGFLLPAYYIIPSLISGGVLGWYWDDLEGWLS